MRYVLINLFFLGVLCYTIHLFAEGEPEKEKNTEIDPDYVPDWNATIREIERDVEVHQSWDYMGIGR